MKFFKLILIVSLLTIALPAQLGAQGRTSYIPNTNTPVSPARKKNTVELAHIFDNLPPEVQEELIDEALAAKSTCEGTGGGQSRQDCECVSMKFLDARLLAGPEPNKDAIWLALDVTECNTSTMAAGHMYDLCTEVYSRHSASTEQVCECTAREGAKKIGKNPNLTSGQIFWDIFFGCGGSL